MDTSLFLKFLILNFNFIRCLHSMVKPFYAILRNFFLYNIAIVSNFNNLSRLELK